MARIPPRRQFSPGDFGIHISSLTRFLLWLYGGVWLSLVLLTQWLPGGWTRVPLAGEFGDTSYYDFWTLLVLYPPGQLVPGSPGFHIWQVVTSHFVHPPLGSAVITVVLNLLMLAFFVAPVENMVGRRRFLMVWVGSAVGAVLGTILFGALQGAGAPTSGIGPGIIALVVVFCALMPEATINLFFVLPIKAKYIGWFTAGLTILFALASPQSGGAEIGGLGLGYAAWRWGDELSPRRIRLRRKAREVSKRIAKFEVIDGGGSPPGDDDPPVYH